jgi:hypothetical protein
MEGPLESSNAQSNAARDLIAALNEKLNDDPAIAQQAVHALEPGGALWDLEWAWAEDRSEEMSAFAEALGLSRQELSLLMSALNLAKRPRANFQV